MDEWLNAKKCNNKNVLRTLKGLSLWAHWLLGRSKSALGKGTPKGIGCLESPSGKE